LFLALKCQALQLRRIRGGDFYTRIDKKEQEGGRAKNLELPAPDE
jgi:hypothetical protein